jgi:alkanesulfonate monooxygenase SsuD/methylene tetrahydromethanopterin reductase-like flavin-dependent oxidoreductase (luciferase family)
MWLSAETIAGHAERLAELASEHGRPAPGIALVAFCNVGTDRRQVREQAAAFIRNHYGLPFEKVERWALLGDVDDVAEKVAAYRAAGVSGFCLAAAHPAPLKQVEAIAAVREAVKTA